MPWKDPNNWLSAEIMAPILAFVLSMFRTIQQGTDPSWLRRILESVICGMITLSAGYAIDAMGMSGEWKYAAAGAIGFLGTEFIRSAASRFIDWKFK